MLQYTFRYVHLHYCLFFEQVLCTNIMLSYVFIHHIHHMQYSYTVIVIHMYMYGSLIQCVVLRMCVLCNHKSFLGSEQLKASLALLSIASWPLG